MIGIPGNVRIYLACGVTDMRRGFDSLAAQVQTVLSLDPHLCGGSDYVAELPMAAVKARLG
jgi:transposase